MFMNASIEHRNISLLQSFANILCGVCSINISSLTGLKMISSQESEILLMQTSAGFAFEQCDGMLEHRRDHGEAFADAFG